DVLDDGVGQGALGEAVQGVRGGGDLGGVQEVVAEAGTDLDLFGAQPGEHLDDRVAGGLGDGVHHAGLVVDLDAGAAGGGGRGADAHLLVDRVGQKLAGEVLNSLVVERGLDEVDAGDVDLANLAETRTCFGESGVRGTVGLAGAGADFNPEDPG